MKIRAHDKVSFLLLPSSYLESRVFDFKALVLWRKKEQSFNITSFFPIIFFPGDWKLLNLPLLWSVILKPWAIRILISSSSRPNTVQVGQVYSPSSGSDYTCWEFKNKVVSKGNGHVLNEKDSRKLMVEKSSKEKAFFSFVWTLLHRHGFLFRLHTHIQSFFLISLKIPTKRLYKIRFCEINSWHLSSRCMLSDLILTNGL